MPSFWLTMEQLRPYIWCRFCRYKRWNSYWPSFVVRIVQQKDKPSWLPDWMMDSQKRNSGVFGLALYYLSLSYINPNPHDSTTWLHCNNFIKRNTRFSFMLLEHKIISAKMLLYQWCIAVEDKLYRPGLKPLRLLFMNASGLISLTTETVFCWQN